MNVNNNTCCCKCFNSNFEFQHENRKIVVVTDRKSKTTYRYINKTVDYISKYHIDGGVIQSGLDKKCDYLLINCNKQQAIFIELKGSDLKEASLQILRSIDLLQSTLKHMSIHARIVLTRVNVTDLTSISYLTLEKRIQSLNGKLIKQSRLLEEDNR